MKEKDFNDVKQLKNVFIKNGTILKGYNLYNNRGTLVFLFIPFLGGKPICLYAKLMYK